MTEEVTTQMEHEDDVEQEETLDVSEPDEGESTTGSPDEATGGASAFERRGLGEGAASGRAVPEEPKTLTQEEVAKLLQAEADRRVTTALQTQERRLRAELDSELSRRQEAIEDERLKEQGRYQELFERTQAELDGLKADVATKDFQNRATALLREKGVPEFTDILLGDRGTLDGIAQAADAVAELVEGRIAAAVAERLNTGTPVRGSKLASERPLAEMTSQEFEDWKRAHGIFG